MNEADVVLLETWMRERNAEAFKTLAKRYAGMVYGTCRRILNNPGEAEEVAQECFEILAATKEPVGEYLAPWLHRVACNRSLTRLRSERRRKEREAQFAAELEAGREVAWKDIYGFVDEAIAELPDQLRIPVVAHFLDDQTHSAIALTLGISRRTVTNRIDSGVELLRKVLKSRGVAMTGMALAGLIKANVAEAAPPTLIINLGKLALSGAKHAAAPAAATTAAKISAGFLTTKTIVAAAVLVLASVLVYLNHEREPPVPQRRLPRPVASNKAPADGTPGARAQGPIQPVLKAAEAGPSADKGLAAPSSVSGRVTDSEGNGIVSAIVKLEVCRQKREQKEPLGTFTASVQPNGTYRITDIQVSGAVHVTVSAKGYVTVDSNLNRSAPGFAVLGSLEQGAQIENVDFMLDRAVGLVTGRVVDESRTPVAGALVKAAMPFETQQTFCWHPTTSEENGAFGIPLPAEGECVLIAQKPGYGPAYLAGVQSGASNIELMLRTGGVIAGRVTGRNGTPLSGVAVLALGENGSGKVGNEWESAGRTKAVTDTEGRYRIADLSEDFTYTVRVGFPMRDELVSPKSPRTQSDFLVKMEEQVRAIYDANFGSTRTGVVEKSGVRVRAGQVTQCDLVVRSSKLVPAAIYGPRHGFHSRQSRARGLYLCVFRGDCSPVCKEGHSRASGHGRNAVGWLVSRRACRIREYSNNHAQGRLRTCRRRVRRRG